MPTVITMTVPQLAAMCVEHMPDEAWNPSEWVSIRSRHLCYLLIEEEGSAPDSITPIFFIPKVKRSEIGAACLMTFSVWWRSFKNASEALNELWKAAQSGTNNAAWPVCSRPDGPKPVTNAEGARRK